MQFDAYIHREGKAWLAEFPDCPGCQTFADSRDALPGAAAEALEGWLESHLVLRQGAAAPAETQQGAIGWEARARSCASWTGGSHRDPLGAQ